MHWNVLSPHLGNQLVVSPHACQTLLLLALSIFVHPLKLLQPN